MVLDIDIHSSLKFNNGAVVSRRIRHEKLSCGRVYDSPCYALRSVMRLENRDILKLYREHG